MDYILKHGKCLQLPENVESFSKNVDSSPENVQGLPENIHRLPGISIIRQNFQSFTEENVHSSPYLDTMTVAGLEIPISSHWRVE